MPFVPAPRSLPPFLPAVCLLGLLLWGPVRATAQPIQLHPDNPHYFLYQERPAVLVTSAEHYGAVLNLDFDYQTYLATLARDSLNYTRIFTGAYVEKPGAFGIEQNTLAPAPGRFIAPWARSDTAGYVNGGPLFDLDRWSPAYFERLRDFVATAARHGIVVEVTLFCALYQPDSWRYSPLHPENNITHDADVPRERVHTVDNGPLLAYQEALTREIVRSLNAFDNVFFEVMNEPYGFQKAWGGSLHPTIPVQERAWQNLVDLPKPAVLAWQEHIASVIAEEEAGLPKQHLIAQNYSNFRYPIPEVAPEISILNFHYAWPEAVTLNYGFDRVVGFDESGFAGRADSTYRRQAWNFMLAGGGLFNHLDYSFTVGHEDGTAEQQAPGGGSPALRAQLKVLKRFLESLPLTDMRPAAHLVRRAPNTFPRMLAAEGRHYALYVDGRLTGDLVIDLPASHYRITWIDPPTGTVLEQQEHTHEGGDASLSPPAYEREVAVRIERVEL